MDHSVNVQRASPFPLSAMPFHGHGQCLVPETGFGKQRSLALDVVVSWAIHRSLQGRKEGRGPLPGIDMGVARVEHFYITLQLSYILLSILFPPTEGQINQFDKIV